MRWTSDEAPYAGWNNCTARLGAQGDIRRMVCHDLDLNETEPDDGGTAAGDAYAGRFRLRPSCRMGGTLTVVEDGATFLIRGFVDRPAHNMHGVIYGDGVPNDVLTFTGAKR